MIFLTTKILFNIDIKSAHTYTNQTLELSIDIFLFGLNNNC